MRVSVLGECVDTASLQLLHEAHWRARAGELPKPAWRSGDPGRDPCEQSSTIGAERGPCQPSRARQRRHLVGMKPAGTDLAIAHPARRPSGFSTWLSRRKLWDAEEISLTGRDLPSEHFGRRWRKEWAMIYYALVFLIVGLIAGALGLVAAPNANAVKGGTALRREPLGSSFPKRTPVKVESPALWHLKAIYERG
jgi:hypothetical protein